MSNESTTASSAPETETFAVLVLPYSLDEFPRMTYAMLRSGPVGEKRWQGLTGHGQRGEQPIDAARRHAWHTVGVPPESAFVALDLPRSGSTVPPGQALRLPEYAFAALVDPAELSVPEPEELCWVAYDIAHQLLRRDSERHALWDLRRRIGRATRSAQPPTPDSGA